ncbi:MAG: hypothetical protein ACK53L_33860 [Pirellulaceae bacterium]
MGLNSKEFTDEELLAALEQNDVVSAAEIPWGERDIFLEEQGIKPGGYWVKAMYIYHLYVLWKLRRGEKDSIIPDYYFFVGLQKLFPKKKNRAMYYGVSRKEAVWLSQEERTRVYTLRAKVQTRYQRKRALQKKLREKRKLRAEIKKNSQASMHASSAKSNKNTTT